MSQPETIGADDAHDSFAEGRVVALQLLLAVPILFVVMDLDVLAPGYNADDATLAGALFVIGPPLLLLFVFLLGLPIRLDPTPRNFWTGSGRISMFGILASLALLAVAWVFGHTLTYELEGHLRHDFVPNDILSCIGILALAFFLMNARFPFMESTPPEPPSPT